MANISIQIHFFSIMKKLFQILLKLKPQHQQLPVNISTPPAPPSLPPSSYSFTTLDLPETSLAKVGDHEQRLPASVIGEVDVQQRDLTMIVMAFCFASAADIALQSVKSGCPQFRSTSHYLLSLLIVFAFFSVFVARFINFNKYPFTARMLELLGVFFAVAAFCYAITIPLPLALKCTTWALFGLSVLAIFVCNCLL